MRQVSLRPLLRGAALRIPQLRELYEFAQRTRLQRDRLALQIAATELDKLELERHRDSLSLHVQSLERIVSELHGELAALRDQRTGLEEMLHVRTTEAAGRINELEQELEYSRAAAAKIPGLEAARHGDAVRIRDLEQALSAARMEAANIGELERALAASDADSTRIHELEQALEGIPAMQSRINRLEAEIVALHAQLRDAGIRAQSLERERDILQARLADLSIVTENQTARVLGKLSLLEYRFADVRRSSGSDFPTSGPSARALVAANTVSPAVSRYLDLLEASLVGSLTEDPAMPTPNRQERIVGQYDAELRLVGRDWPQHATTMIGTVRMRNLRHLVERTIRDSVGGDLIETGVWRGGACIYMRAILEAYGISDRTVWVADSFAGLPPPNPALYPADASDTHYQYAELAVSLDEVKANFARYNLLDGQVQFLEGWFKDTLPAAPIEKLSILRLDGDMYESTMQALDALYWKVAPGGYVIVDDFVLPACREAVVDFRARHNIVDPLEEIDGAAVFWQVTPGAVRQAQPAYVQPMAVAR